jgi:GT2 family glycosyltransferase
VSHDDDRTARARVLKIQGVLYENDAAALEHFLTALAVCPPPPEYRVWLHLGDCSAQPLLSAEDVARWHRAGIGEPGDEPGLDVRYTFFGANLGFGRGHNQLWQEGRLRPEGQLCQEAPTVDRLLIINADAVPAFHLLTRLSRLADAHPGYGAVEARQMPIEHAKRFDPVTGETDWVSGACFLLDAVAFDALGGFDELFFMYGEDVDLSWRLRAAGRRLYYCPDTFLCHAKRLVDGRVDASDAERRHGALSSLLLRAKYGREDLNGRALAVLRTDPSPLHVWMLAEYERLRPQVTLATPEQCAVPSFTPRGDFVDQRWTYPLSRHWPGEP